MKLSNLEGVVEETLRKFKICRKDDFVLMFAVFREICPAVSRMGFAEVMRNHQTLNLPSFASVTRCRRKIMELHPELKDAKVSLAREDKIADYQAYNLGLDKNSSEI